MGIAWQLDLGAWMIEADRVWFKVWAPFANTVAVELVDWDRTAIPMQPASQGYLEVTVEGVGPRALPLSAGREESPTGSCLPFPA